MLKIECADYLAEVETWAKENGCIDKLESRLDYLRNYGGAPDFTECYLYKDFAPHSFEFVIEREGKRWFNGGLIYSGPGQPLDGSFPALTVDLGPSGREHDWSIHT